MGMNEVTNWNGIPYYPISQFYKNKFGEKVYKVPISVAQTCPNREGLKGMKVCNFCDVWGSAAFPEFRDLEIKNQITVTKDRMGRRFKAKKFLVYFQAYTSTFAKTSQLRKQFDIATEFDDVLGFVVGTRPDCLSQAVFDLWNEYLDKGYFLSVELGVQSFNEKQLLWMDRGHTAELSIKAVERIRKNCPKVDLGIHLMFGLPGETDEDIIDAAKKCSTMPIDNVKIHNLHVLKNTTLEKDFYNGKFNPISREDYTRHTGIFIRNLRKDIAVHRLAAVASRHEELVAPEWAKSKLDNYQYILDYMKENNYHQGQLVGPASE